MKKRLACLLLVIVLVVTSVCVAVPAVAISDAEFVAPVITIPETLVVPDNDMLTNNVTYYLAEGSRWEQLVTADFMAEGFKSRGTYNYQKYIVVHNTGAYPVSSTALANHTYGKTTDAEVSWHFTCGNDGIYQMIPVNEKGWHAGGNYWGTDDVEIKLNMGWVQDASNSTGIGIETATPGFPADSTSSGEHWDSEEMYEWYENTYDSTATYLAELVASLCVRLNFNPYTQIVQHFNTANKNCPIQMRYVFGTNAQFTTYGTYYKVFLDRMYDYYEAFGGSYVSTDTLKNTYYNPSSIVYNKGLYKANAETTVYRAGNTTTGAVGTVDANTVVDVKVVGFDWGKITLANGTEGWVKLDAFTYVTDDYDYGTYRTEGGEIIEITAIDGTTGTYAGGTVDMTKVTRVYKVEVENDTEFGSEPKYFASGESFSVTAVAPVAPLLYDIWETTDGVAKIENKEAEKTTVTVLNSDIKLKATYRDKYFLSVEYGVGSGKYDVGDEVTVTARARVGYTFTNWSVVSGEGTFTDANAATTKFVMGQDDTVITANYQISKDIDLSGLTNFALNQSYTFKWRDATGDGIEWRGSLKDLELKKLTDGKIATSGFSEIPSLYVGVMGTNGMAEVVVNLSEAKKINKVVLRDIADNGGSFADLISTSIAVSISDDGVEYTPVEGLVDTLYFSYKVGEDGSVTQFTNLYTHSIDFAQISAKFVKIRFQSSKYLMTITEVEVYGPTVQGDEPVVELGDANGDGEIDNLDAAAVLKYDAGEIDEISNCDVNNDGEIDNLDAALILKYDAGIIDKF